MELYQYLLIVFVLFAESRVFLQFKNKKVGVGQFLFWTGVWSCVVVFGLFAPYLWFISDILGISRLADVFVYVSVGIIFYLIYRIYIKVECLEHEITRVTRIIAFKENKLENNKKDGKKNDKFQK